MTDDRLISFNAAIDALHTWFRDGFDEDKWWNSTHVLAAIEGLPSAQRLLEDGTLIVTVPSLSAVHRVIVDAEDSQYCKTFYQDGDEEDGKDGDT